jgi:hypothetical protein
MFHSLLYALRCLLEVSCLQEADLGTEAAGLRPSGSGTLVLAAPVSGSCLAGKFVNVLQGLQHASVVDLTQLTHPRQATSCDADNDTAGASTTSLTPAAVADSESAQLARSNGAEPKQGAAVHLSSHEQRSGALGRSTLRVTVSNSDTAELPAHTSSDVRQDSDIRTPTAGQAESTDSSSALPSHPTSHLAESMSKIGCPSVPETDATNAAATVPEPWTFLPSLSTVLSQKDSKKDPDPRDNTVRSSYEESPGVQEMVHAAGGPKETPSAAQSPSSGLLGMLVSMVSTSISPKRGESSSVMQCSAFQATSPTSPPKESSGGNGAEVSPQGAASNYSKMPALPPLNVPSSASLDGSHRCAEQCGFPSP